MIYLARRYMRDYVLYDTDSSEGVIFDSSGSNISMIDATSILQYDCPKKVEALSFLVDLTKPKMFEMMFMGKKVALRGYWYTLANKIKANCCPLYGMMFTNTMSDAKLVQVLFVFAPGSITINDICALYDPSLMEDMWSTV